MKRKEIEKDPFAEYDKFWDELDEAEDIKADEDYFKERSVYKKQGYTQDNKKQRYHRSNKNEFNKMIKGFSVGAIVFLIFGFMILVRFTGSLTVRRIIFVLPSFIFFGIFMSVVIFVLSKLKNQ